MNLKVLYTSLLLAFCLCACEEPDIKVISTGGGNASLPSGAMLGINYNPDNSVTLVLHEKDKDGMKYDYCYLISELSGWKINGDYAMKRDEKAGCWWITLDGLDPDKEYMYQYHVGNEEGSFRVCDPYSEITYDPWNDPYISSTYPDLPEYPSGATGLVSAFRINRPAFRWDDFSIEDDDDIVIYELLLRDFTSTKDLNGALSRISYLKDLGVNAIELMPVQEFDGNLSWGYNPNSYFAMDKAYGTREMYKTFINECHKAGLAVLLDVVYNHATGIHPMAALYWNTAGNETAANNPWFNVSAPHPYNVFHDWNHENQTVRDMVKRNLTYLMDEYNVDGFRFDMTKGFTQRQCTENNASDYDAGRIAILKDYNSAIRAHNPDAVVILEHFCEWKEEKELAEAGMKVWRNMNYAYCQSAMGWSEGSDFSGLYSGTANMPFGSLVGFMESHDEERTAYKQTAYGNGNLKTDLAARMQREELNAAFFLTVPGPKMIWQFGEMGYDISIEYNGRTGEKPLRWQYLEESDRKELHDTYRRLLGFRNENPEFFDENADFSWNVGTDNWSSGRTLSCTAGDKAFMVIGNFDTVAHDITASLPVPGTWRDRFAGNTEILTSGTSVTLHLPAGEYKLLVNF